MNQPINKLGNKRQPRSSFFPTVIFVCCAWAGGLALVTARSAAEEVPAAAENPVPPAASVPETPAGAVLKPLDYSYQVSWGGLGIGRIDVSLKPDSSADKSDNCYVYKTISHPTSLVRSVYGAPNETSQFCVEGGVLRSRHFDSVLPDDQQQSYSLSFDWNKHIVTDENGQIRNIPDSAVDSFALQQAVRLWVVAHARDADPPIAKFDMVDRKNLTHYQFKLVGHEHIRTPAGNFDALKMERIDNPKKQGHFWLAVERDYMPVKIETRNGNKPAVTFTLVR